MAMSGHDDHVASRERAFFGRRKGHRLRSRQADLMATLLPRLALTLDQPHPNKLAQVFSRPVEAVRLEIGFGGGINLPPLIRAASFVAGVDRSPSVVRRASSQFAFAVRSGRAAFQVASVEALPFATASFDKVCTVNSKRVTNPG